MGLNSDAAAFIESFEGFTSRAMWDVNAYRIGVGSDTITLPNGTYRNVVSTDYTTKELALQDLDRRVDEEFIPKVQEKIGFRAWDRLTREAKIALVDLAYNYGTIALERPAGSDEYPIVDAAKSGNLKRLADAIVTATINDNKSQSIGIQNALKKRRQAEADLILSSIWKKRLKIVLLILLALGIVGFSIWYYRKKKNKK